MANRLKKIKNKPTKIISKSVARKNSGEPDIHEMNAAMELLGQGRFLEVVALAEQMTIQYPLHSLGWKILSAVFKQMGRMTDALPFMQKAAILSPNDAETYCNLGIIHSELGQYTEALNSCYRALEITPDNSTVYCIMGSTLQRLGQFDAAMQSFHRALELDPNNAEAHSNLGINLHELGLLEEAVASNRRALEIKPNDFKTNQNLLFLLSHSETIEAQALFTEHCLFAEQYETPLRPHWPKHTNSKNPDRCLRVGFVSADFYNHSVANFIESILVYMAKYPQVSLYGYYNNSIEDKVTQRLKGYMAHWQLVVGLSDAALAQIIQDEGIDILIDLSGHTSKNRLLTFARKPAPVQISWIGYPGTTGLQSMDYYISDQFFLPPGQFDTHFTEKIIRLPASAPFLPYEDAPPITPLPALYNGYLTFGSFNRLNKIHRSVVGLWSQLLRTLPNARMVLAAMAKPGENDQLIEWFAQEGIARERLSFHAKCSMEDYLALHNQIDICLDTFPYNGGTTTCHALWMGVPTLTLAGGTVPGRTGTSALGHVGLEAFVAHNKTEFVEKGLYWASHLAELGKIRDGLRARFRQSAVSQPEVIAAALERALRTIWQRWCDGLPADSFEVSLQDRNNMMQEIDK